MIFVIISLVLLLLISLYKYFTKEKDYWQKRGVPYVNPLPIFGNYFHVLTLRRSIGQNLANLYKKHRTPYFGTFILNTPQLVVNDPDLIKLIFLNDFNHFCDHAICSDIEADPLISQITFLMNSPDWKLIRPKTTYLFTPGRIKNMVEPINKVAEKLKGYINSNLGQNLDIKSICVKYVADILASFAFGVDAQSFESESGVLKNFGSSLFRPTRKSAVYQHIYYLIPGIVTTFKLPFMDPTASDCLRKILCEVIEERMKSKIMKNDAIDAVIELFKERELEGGPKFADDTILAQALQYFVAGFETSTTTTSYTLYELTINSDIQSKLREEIQRNLGGNDSFSYNAIQNMKYLHAVVCETLRKYPILPFIDRICAEDYRFPNSNFVIEKGLTILVPVLGLHRDPKYFPEPERFDPQRFSDDNKDSFPSCCYLPFGQGPRSCVGERLGLLMIKLCVINVLLNFELEVCSETPIPLTFEPRHFLLIPAGKMPIKFKKLVTK